MFQTLIHLLTATTFVAHGLLGCCWHHTHSHGVSTEHGVAASNGCHDHGHPHAHHSPPTQIADTDDHGNRNSGAPHEPGCDEDQCVFVRTQDTLSSAAAIPPALVPFLVAAHISEMPGLGESDSRGFRAFHEAPPPSAPLSALCQVRLI